MTNVNDSDQASKKSAKVRPNIDGLIMALKQRIERTTPCVVINSISSKNMAVVNVVITGLFFLTNKRF